jgi:hypothetical protein
MGQRVIINHQRTLFYCWSWDRWCSVQQLGKYGHAGGCFARGCRRMYEPALPHLRTAEVRRASRGNPAGRPVRTAGGDACAT